MNVLQVVNQLNAGGIETLLLRALPRLKAAGMKIDVCCLGEEGVFDEAFRGQGCRLHRMRKSLNCYATARDFRRLLAGEDYSLVHSHFGYTSGGIARGADLQGIPAVVSVHSAEPLTLYRWRSKPVLAGARRRWLAWQRRLAERHATVFLCHSDANRDGFLQAGREAGVTPSVERYSVIHNGVAAPGGTLLGEAEARNRLKIPETARVVLHVGSFREEKNHAGLLRIFARVHQQRPETLLVLVGDGHLRSEITAQAKSLGISSAVRFAGMQRDVWPWYAAADLFLFPSTTEGFGNAVVEAEMAGVPVVASDIAAHRESVAPAQQRFLFAANDNDEAARLAMEQLDAPEAERAAWVEDSQRHAHACFSMDQYVDALLASYQQCVEQPARLRDRAA